MRYFIFSLIPALALAVALPPFTQEVKDFIWSPDLDEAVPYTPGGIIINNKCPHVSYVSEAWPHGGHGPWPIAPSQITTLPLRDYVGGVDVKFTGSPGPPQNPVELSYAFDPSDTTFNFDLVTVSPNPDFHGSVVVHPSPPSGRCQLEYWQPGRPPYPPGQQVCPANTNLFVSLC